MAIDRGILDVGPNQVQRTAIEDDRFYVRTTFFDDAALARNNQIRNAGMLDKGKLGLHENEDIRIAISCPSTEQWMLFKRSHPDVYTMLNAKDEPTRIKGAWQLKLLHPEWIVMDRL